MESLKYAIAKPIPNIAEIRVTTKESRIEFPISFIVLCFKK